MANHNPETFVCMKCLGTFYKAWSDQEAFEASKKDFMEASLPEKPVFICEECYELENET